MEAFRDIERKRQPQQCLKINLFIFHSVGTTLRNTLDGCHELRFLLKLHFNLKTVLDFFFIIIMFILPLLPPGAEGPEYYQL